MVRDELSTWEAHRMNQKSIFCVRYGIEFKATLRRYKLVVREIHPKLIKHSDNKDMYIYPGQLLYRNSLIVNA